MFLLALASAAAAPAQSFDAASLLALHLQYVGWQFGDGTFTSMRAWGDAVNTKPSPGTTPQPPQPMVLLSRGAVFRETQLNPETGGALNWGFTGSLFWESDANGFKHPVIGDAQKADISYEFLFNEGTAGLSGALQSPVSIDGTSYPVVRVSPEAGFPIDLAVDPHTGAYVRAVIDPGGDYETTIDIVSYQQAEPGKRVIANYRYHDSPNYTFEWSKFVPNVPVADNELTPPPQTATWTFANPNPFPVNTRNYDGFIIVTATVNGVPGTFIVDTGTTTIVLTSTFAKRARVRRASNTSLCGIGWCESADTDVVDSIAIGGNTLSHVFVLSSPLGNYPHGVMGGAWTGHGPQDLDGVLGYDLLGGAVVKLDFGASTMSILNPATTDLSHELGAVVTTDLSGGQPWIPMTLNDSIHVKALLDTGDAMGIGYGSKLLYTYHVSAMRNWYNCGSLGKISIGKISYEGEQACDIGMPGPDLLVGIDFLRHFNLVLDYPQGIIIMNPLRDTF